MFEDKKRKLPSTPELKRLQDEYLRYFIDQLSNGSGSLMAPQLKDWERLQRLLQVDALLAYFKDLEVTNKRLPLNGPKFPDDFQSNPTK